MHYLNLQIAKGEMAKLAKHKKAKVPTDVLMCYVLNYCLPKPEPLQNDTVRWCERLYALPDPRGVPLAHRRV
jgi:hypothetical protein